MQELDSKTQDLVSKINGNADEYISNVNLLTSKDKINRFKDIHDSFEKAKVTIKDTYCHVMHTNDMFQVISDDKVQLAMQTYEMVDKHIRRLDSELSKLESELKDKSIHSSSSVAATEEATEVTKGKKRSNSSQAGRGDKKKGLQVTPKSVMKGSNKSIKKETAENVPSASTSLLARADLPPLVALQAAVNMEGMGLEMPVDPNEPTYCTCHQVSYGEMIGCDNPDCTIEWFHFGCVGLTSKPKGKWYCMKCTQDRKKK